MRTPRKFAYWHEAIPHVLNSLVWDGSATAYTMAKRIGCSPNTARKALKSLSAKLMVEPKTVKHRANAVKVIYSAEHWVEKSMRTMRGY